MKQYSELTEAQKTIALSKMLEETVTACIEAPEFFPELVVRLAAAAEKADEMRTPWFISQYIMDTCRADITALAIARCKMSQYSEDDNLPIISGVA